jgi:micrococcal nuclease
MRPTGNGVPGLLTKIHTHFLRGRERLGPESRRRTHGVGDHAGSHWFGPNAVPNVGSGLTAPTFSGTVTRVVDGDTFYMTGQDVRIRVWVLDAPEVGTYGGSAATAAMSSLLAGDRLKCRKRDTDRYSRTVGQCFLSDGRDIAAAMIGSGTATEYCRFSRNHYGTCWRTTAVTAVECLNVRV